MSRHGAKPKVRCAVYTRKSSEEGLEQEFNSLDAQRAAGEAYIASQSDEGWLLVPDRYDDGGISGATLERPALKRLLADVEAGRIDCVVVYKVDRLSRSLTDFAKLVDIFERHGVSFVSVTQHFCTTTSMGRLTLNILLSFAQFEREVIGERIRDKFAASRAKGMWMGGHLPLGYDIRDRKLVVNPAEAELVRLIFRRFLDLGSALLLIRELNAQAYRTKSWTPQTGTFREGRPFDKGTLYKILRNRTYLGEAVHKGRSYPGEHEPIVDRATWDRVHEVLATNANRSNEARARTPAGCSRRRSWSRGPSPRCAGRTAQLRTPSSRRRCHRGPRRARAGLGRALPGRAGAHPAAPDRTDRRRARRHLRDAALCRDAEPHRRVGERRGCGP
jgi:site-specific DNA recombinase